MTWEEWKQWSKLVIEDPERNYCLRSDCGACLGDDLKYQRELLQAFSDELVKRIRINHGGLVTTDIVQERINELLTEAGVER